jgi:hypothetical protein
MPTTIPSLIVLGAAIAVWGFLPCRHLAAGYDARHRDPDLLSLALFIGLWLAP